MTEQHGNASTRALVGTLILAALIVAASVFAQAHAVARDVRVVDRVELAGERVRAYPEAARRQFGVRIMEDDPRWNCATMGNLRCGPGAAHPRTGERITRGHYRPVPRAWYGLRVERASGARGWVTLRKGCTRHVRGGTPFVCKGGVGTF